MDCIWGEWQPWSSCDKGLKYDETQTRNRTVKLHSQGFGINCTNGLCKTTDNLEDCNLQIKSCNGNKTYKNGKITTENMKRIIVIITEIHYN